MVKPGVPFLDEEAADRSLGLRPDDGDVGDAAVRDPRLRAVEDPRVAVFARVRAHAAGVRAEVGLGETEAADRLAGGKLRNPVVALLFRAVGVDRIHDETRLHGRERAQARVAALELLHDQAVGHVAEAGKVVFLDRRAEQPHLRHLRHEVVGKLLLAIRMLDDRKHFLIDEIAHGLAHHQLLFGEERIDIHVVNAGKIGHGELLVVNFGAG